MTMITDIPTTVTNMSFVNTMTAVNIMGLANIMREVNITTIGIKIPIVNKGDILYSVGPQPGGEFNGLRTRNNELWPV